MTTYKTLADLHDDTPSNVGGTDDPTKVAGSEADTNKDKVPGADEEKNKGVIPPQPPKDGNNDDGDEGDEGDDDGNEDGDEDENKNKDGKGDKGDEGDEDDDDPKAFWNDVAALTGEDVDVDFGDVIPDSPEGVVKYLTAFREKGIASFEEQLKANFPREYQALLIANDGGDPSVLYKENKILDYSTVQIEESNVEQQKTLYRDFLKEKGLPDSEIEDYLKFATDAGKLLEKSKLALAELNKSAIERNRIQEENAKKEKEEKAKIANDFIGKVSAIVSKGNVEGFIIPEKERKALADNFLQNVRLDNKKIILTKELSEEELGRYLQAEYLMMKKGNLADIVQRKQDTAKTRRLSNRIKNEKSKGTGGKGEQHNTKILRLSDV